MDNVVDRLNSLVLSAQEIRSLTGWDDAMVEDYLNILRNLIELANSLDGSDEVTLQNINLIALNAGSLGKLKSLVSHQAELINSVLQLVIHSNKLQAKISQQARQIKQLQQGTVDNNKLRVRVNQHSTNAKRIEQQAVGW